jgi:hypothetical protein
MAADIAGRAFNVRAFVALVITLSGAGLPATGLANHILGTSPLTPARHAWMAAHNALALVFTAFVLWHVALNLRPLSGHLRRVLASVPRVGREGLLAAGIVGLAVLFAAHPFVIGH